MMLSVRRLAVAFAIAAASSACSTSSSFSTDTAMQHVRALATTIGTRPAGTAANEHARDYIIEHARRAGFDVRVQEADGMRPVYGATAHVRNIIATRPGRRPHAIALVTHYDSVPDGPGAADDALGVAVCLEAGRVLAARPHPEYALALVFTDGEELGLMGASALLKDPIIGWMRAVLNFESVGSAGSALMFQATPGSGSLVRAWRDVASRPNGSSFMPDIYRRLPADTDLSIFGRARLAGLDFAPAADSYPYHTPRDAADRLDPSTVRQMGENAVRIVEALDRQDLSQRAETPRTYFDIARLRAVAYGPWMSAALFALALLVGLFGFVQTLSVALAEMRWTRLFLTAVWALVGVALVFGSMVAAAWLLRATRESYHPWYAHPDRFFIYELLAGAVGAWVVMRVGSWLPPAARGSVRPSAMWTIILPVWMALALVAQVLVPSSAYLAVVPLVAAGIAIAVLSTRKPAGAGLAALVVLLVSAVVWVPDAVLLLHFVVAQFGRLPVITPIVVYPVLLLGCGLFVVPPFLGLIAARSAAARNRPRSIATGYFLVSALVLAAGWCWFARAYTDERPLQRSIRYVQNVATGQAYWEAGGNEPGIEVEQQSGMTGPWHPVSAVFDVGTPLDRLQWPPPFAYRSPSSIAATAPAEVSAKMTCEAGTCDAEVRALPHAQGLVIIFALPHGVLPEESNLAGIVEDGVYRAVYGAVPAEGLTFHVRVGEGDARKMEQMRVAVMDRGVPGGAFPHLPAWLPQEHIVWHARSYFVMPVRFDNLTSR